MTLIPSSPDAQKMAIKMSQRLLKGPQRVGMET